MERPLTARLCGHCPANMVELLSDEAGVVFGCPICRRVDTGPPCIVERRTLSPRERRRMARAWHRGRIGRRRGVRVNRAQEHLRPRPDQLVVMRRDHLHSLRGAERADLGNGWVLGLIQHPNHWRGPLLVRSPPPNEARWPLQSVQAIWITETAIRLEPVGGMAWGHFDKTAPVDLVIRAFRQLGHERLERALSVLELRH